ncbi:retrovirus-related pol polyprotein from transposon TNT 1-94, partial [Tanacetum coccineum]
MSTSKTYQQSLADAGSETRPPMLERGSYIPWASRFRRYINRKRENRKWLNKALDEGPYQFEMFIPNNSTVPKLQTAEDLQGDALLHYDAEMELMNLILLSIPNDIYNSVDACTSAKDMWKRVERLMRGTIQNKVDRETRFTNEFDQFVAEPGEALVSVYNRFAQLMNDLERNDMHFPIVTINTKFLNSLQPEWLKYVTQVRLAKRLTVDTFDDLFDYLQQFEKLVNVSRAKKLEKSHDPLALDDVHTNSEDPLASAMLLLARAITQKFSTLTNNHLRTSSNTINQAIIQGDRVNIQSRNSDNVGRNNRRAYVQEEIVEGSNALNETGNVKRTLRTSSSGNTSTVQCYGCSGKGHYARNCLKPRVRDSKYFMEQMLLAKYFPTYFIPSDKNSNATPSIPVSMPSDSPLIIELDKIKNCFQRLSELIQKNCKRASIFYTSPEEIQLNDFCQDQLKPIVNELQFYFEFFKTLFQGDIKEMKDVFESTESALCEQEKQNDFLKDQLLEVSLKHEVELSVLLNHECVDNSLHAEIEQLKKKSIEIQEGLQAKIKSLEKDVQRCEKQSVDFELKLQHEKEKHKWDSSFQNKNTNPLDYSWISKMEKLEDENVSLDFTVQSLIKERDNVKLEYQKLFNSIKKTRSQTQTEMDELIAHVSEKTYAYGAIRAENQNLLITISELKTRLANVEKGKSVNTKFDKTNGSQPLLCVTPLHKHVIQKKTDVQKSKENHVMSKPVTLQTSPTKQRGVNSNKNVIAPGMYKVVTTHESQTNEAKHDLSSTGMNAASSVRRPMNRDSHVKDSVLANSKKPAKKVAVYVRKNKQTDITSETVISNKENVIDIDVANAPKAKTLLCVSCMQNVLIPCHDNCFANYKLNVRSNVRRPLSTKSRTPKSYDTTYVVRKTRFSKESTLSKSLDTTYVVSKPKIDVGSTSKANDKVVQIVLWIVDSGCSKHMTAITGYGDYIQGNITIFHVYYVEGLGHNLFSVGQFCDGDLEVAFRSKTCYVRNLEGDDLLTGGRVSNLYTIFIFVMAASLPVCLMSKATLIKLWLWHRILSHLNFGTINDITRLELVDGLPKFKYGKDHLCSACERGKSKKASHPLKLVPSDHSKLELLHMDLCGLMQVASINGKKYILVIVDDYSQYTWVYFLHSKDETPEIIKKFIAQAQLNYKAKVCKIPTDNVVERRNRTLVEAARTMLIFYRLPEFLWAEAVATACFTQNRLIIHTRNNKTPYKLLRGKKPNVEYFHVFGSLCYPTNDRDDLGKMKPKANIGVFIGYSETSRGFRIYNRRTKKVIETINVKFDELTAMPSEHDCLEPELQRFINPNSSAEEMNTPSKEDLDNLFVIIMTQQQHVVEVHPDELCPPNKRYDLMDANKRVDLENVQCPPKSKILMNIIKNHPLRFSMQLLPP